MASYLRRALDGAAFAWTFLTIVPLPARGRHGSNAPAASEPEASTRGARQAPAWFGAVGALIGGAGALAYAAAYPLLGSSLAATVAVAAMAVLTGGLHHDGLADCADGLGARGNRERRLRVMRDPTIGTFGALALLLWLLLITTALGQLSRADAVPALIAAASVARWAALLHARLAPPARREGLGAGFAPSAIAVVVSGLTAAAVVAVAFGSLTAVGALLLAGAVTAGFASAGARSCLGGRTGDTLGATVALAELAVVLVSVATS